MIEKRGIIEFLLVVSVIFVWIFLLTSIFPGPSPMRIDLDIDYEDYVSEPQPYSVLDTIDFIPQMFKRDRKGGESDSSSAEKVVEKVDESSYMIFNEVPGISFVEPTPADNANISDASIEVNITIIDIPNVSSIIYNFNGTNYSYYDKSLVLMMNFDNVSSLGENNTLAVDVSKYGNNATLNNGAFYNTTGKYGYAVQTDGADDYIEILDNATIRPTSEMSIAMWCYAHPNSNIECAIGKHNVGSGSGYAFMKSTDNKFYFQAGDGSWVTYNSYTSAISSTGWYSIVGTHNSSHHDIYINGEFAMSDTGGTITQNTANLWIGRNANTPGDYYTGIVDEVRLWNRSLSASEVYHQYIANLKKYDTDKWLLYVNQSKNATAGLDDGTYSFYACEYNGTTECTETRDISKEDASIGLDLINPTGNVDVYQNKYFNVTVNVSCFGFDCGDINVSLDPISGCDCANEDCGDSCGSMFDYNPTGFSYTSEAWGFMCAYFGDPRKVCYKYVGDYSEYIYATVEDAGCDFMYVSGSNEGDCALYEDAMSFIGWTCPSFTRKGNAVTASDCLDHCFSGGNAEDYFNFDDPFFSGSSGGGVKGLVNYTTGATPFYTNESNPRTINLNSSQSRLVVFYVNATGDLDSVNEFYVYANKTLDMSINNETEHWNVTITEEPDLTNPLIEFVDPTEDDDATIQDNYTQINISIQEENLKGLIFNWNGTNYTYYNDSLVLMMNFDNVSSLGDNSTYVVDLSKYGNDGAFIGAGEPRWNCTDSKYGCALSFDGSDDLIDLGSSAISTLLGGNFVISVWVYSPDFSTHPVNTILSRADYISGPGGKGWHLYVNSTGGIVLDIGVSADGWQGYGWTVYRSLGMLNTNQWHNIIILREGTTGAGGTTKLQIYIDGVNQSLITSGGNDVGETSTKTLMIGKYGPATYQGGTGFFKGNIDEVRIWNRSLSAAEVYQQYIANLKKYDTDKWLLYINQSKNATDGLDDGTYTYQVFAEDTAGNYNNTEERSITKGEQTYVVQNIPISYYLLDSATETIYLTSTGQTGVVSAVLKKDGDKIAEFDINFTQNLNWSNVSSDVDTTNARAFIHFPEGHTQISSVNLLIPSVTASGRVYICPNASSFDHINSSCPGLYYVNVEVSNGYYEVSVSGSGGQEAEAFKSENSTESEWWMFGRFLNHTSYNPGTSLMNFTNVTNATTSAAIWSSPIVANGIVYVGNNGNKFYAFNASNINQSALAIFTTSGQVYGTAAYANGYVYVPADAGNKLHQLNASNISQEIASYTEGSGGLSSSPLVANGYVYIKIRGLSTVQLNASNISQKINSYSMAGTTTSIWDVSPAKYDDYIYSGDATHLYQLNATNISKKITQFNVAANEYVAGSPLIYNGSVYLATSSSVVGQDVASFYQLNATNISQVLSQYDNVYGINGLAAANSFIYAAIGVSHSGGYALYQFDANDVSNLVHTKGFASQVSGPAVGDGVVYVGYNNGFYALNATDVSKTFDSYVIPISNSRPALSNNIVYVGSTDNYLYAFGQEPPTEEEEIIIGDQISENSTESEWWMFGRFLNHTRYNPTTTTDNLTVNVTIFTAGDQVASSPIIANGVVYVGSGDNKVYSLNASNITQKLGEYTTGGLIRSSPAYADGVIYIGSRDNHTYALNASNIAQQLGNYTTDNWIDISSPAVYNGVVYIGSYDGNLYALDASNISRKIGNFSTGGTLDSSPAVYNGVVYVARDYLYALNASNVSQKLSQFFIGGGTASSPTVANDIVYIASSIALYALNASDVSQQLSSYSAANSIGSPAIANGYVYVGSSDNKIYQLNASDISQKIAEFSTDQVAYSSPAVSNGIIYVGTEGNKFYALNASNVSQKLDEYTAGDDILSSPAISDGTVYVGSNDHNLYAFDRGGVSSGYIITNLDGNLDVVDNSETENYESDPQTGTVSGIIKKSSTKIGTLDISFTQNWNWSDIKSDTGTYTQNSKTLGRALLHIPASHTEVSNKKLFIPVNENTGLVYTCPNAESIDHINDSCPSISYSYVTPSGGFYEVDISGTGGAETLTTKLIIWDDMDTSMPYTDGPKEVFEAIDFYANYTNKTTGAPLSGLGIGCNITFYDGVWNGPFAMIYDTPKKIYNYTDLDGYNNPGTYDWNVTCYQTGYGTITANDTITILPLGGSGDAIPEFSHLGLVLSLIIIITTCIYWDKKKH